MKTLDLRTSLFSFTPKRLGHAYRVQISDTYLAAWQVLQNLAKKHHPGLPTNALEEMLAAVSGGPVKVNWSIHWDKGLSAILMLNHLPVETINQVLYLWSLEVMRIWGQQVEGLETKLTVTGLVPLRAEDLIAEDNISSLAYHLVPWLVGKAMCATPLQTTQNGSPDPIPKLITLQQASDGSLVAWDDPIMPEGERTASALHVITPGLKLLRDCSEPFIQLRVKLSQIMPNWIGKKKNAWVHTGQMIVHAGVHSKMTDAGWRAFYDFPTNKLLGFMGVQPLPDLTEGDIPPDGRVRPIFSSPPQNPSIGSGPGPLFLDQACFHLRRSLEGVQPLLARKVVSGLGKAKAAITSGATGIRVGVLVGHSETLLRLTKARETLAQAMPFFKKIAPPDITLTRLEVEGARHMLHGEATTQELNAWVKQVVVPEVRKLNTSVLIVETSLAAAGKSPELDPKHFLRRVLAEHGIVTQFIMHEVPKPSKTSVAKAVVPPSTEGGKKPKKPARDFKALNTVTETIRLSGYFPASFIKAKSMQAGTTVLSIWLDRITGPGNMIYLPVITRTVVGSQKCEVYWFAAGDLQRGKWYQYTEGVAAIHATQSLVNPDAISKLIAWAMLVPTEDVDTPLLVCLDSDLRTFYKGLKDSPDVGLPPMPQGAAVVRIRVGDDVAQMSGNHSDHPDEPRFIGQKIGLFQSQRSPSVYYFVSPSKIYSKAEAQRHNTRYQVDDEWLQTPWQQLGVTELTVLDAGAFSNPTTLVEQVALLCRNAPMWDGQLKLPSPMHLGAVVAGDHPIMEMRRQSEANRQAAKA